MRPVHCTDCISSEALGTVHRLRDVLPPLESVCCGGVAGHLRPNLIDSVVLFGLISTTLSFLSPLYDVGSHPKGHILVDF